MSAKPHYGWLGLRAHCHPLGMIFFGILNAAGKNSVVPNIAESWMIANQVQLVRWEIEPNDC